MSGEEIVENDLDGGSDLFSRLGNLLPRLC